MKKLLSAVLIAGLMIWAGCGSDDDNPTEPPPPDTGITAATGTVAPSMTSVNDTVWNRITPKSVAITSTSFVGKHRPPAALAVASSVAVQAVVVSEVLYMRFTWSDDELDVWPQAWIVDSIDGTNALFEHLVFESQDQLLVLFDALPNDGYDAWHWLAHWSTIDGSVDNPMIGYATGRILRTGAFSTDAGTLNTVRENHYGTFNRPAYLHNDTMDFTGFILLESEADSLDILPLAGWSVGYMVPGFLTDGSVAQVSSTERGSKYDISAVASHSSATNRYTVVLARALNTGYPDDADLSALSTVGVRLGITNESDFNMTQGSSKQGFSAQFELTLP